MIKDYFSVLQEIMGSDVHVGMDEVMVDFKVAPAGSGVRVRICVMSGVVTPSITKSGNSTM